MSFNQHPGHQNLSEQTSNSPPSGNGTSNNGQPGTDVNNANSNRSQTCDSQWPRRSSILDSSNLNEDYHTIPGDVNDSRTQGPLSPCASILVNGHLDSDYQNSSVQNSNSQTPTTRQPPTLPSIAATCGVPSHLGPFNFGPHYPSNDNNTPAPPSLAQAHVNPGPWIPRSNKNAAAPLDQAQLPSNPFGHNPNHPWNNDRALAPPNPHPVVASASGHSAAAGYLPSTFTSGPVSARNQELMNDSTPLEISGEQYRTPNPLGAVGEYTPAYRHWLVEIIEDATARRQARLSNAQTDGADTPQRHRTNSTGTIIVTEQTSPSEIVASLAEAARNGTLPPYIVSAPANPETNEESDSFAGTDTPGSDDEEAEYYNASVCGDVPGAEFDGEEQGPGVDTEAVESEEELLNLLDPEGELAAAAEAVVPPSQ